MSNADTPGGRPHNDTGVEIILREISDLRNAVDAARGLLYRIDTFAITLVSGLVVAITIYEVDLLNLVAPLVVYLAGFMWSSESIRLLKLRNQIRELEISVRACGQLGENLEIPAGFETSTRGRAGYAFLYRHEIIMAASAFLYGALVVLFMYLLAASTYPVAIKFGFIGFYSLFFPILWLVDAWGNRHYLVGK